ncbi:uncharacterized protein LOC124290941 [Haliotis rubra]|uniref:uncharacterized protein LOC124290941 n=1 Tax=Haliotis rubra TaxID=36100 RepID=UPI001EE605C4|nr:uncharacterized protein LOC124290941 [Haliotis rubra]
MAQKSNMTQADQEIELPKSCLAPTEDSLQRLTRGYGSMVSLLNFMSEQAEMEKKCVQIYAEFETKFKEKALIEIGGSMAENDVNAVLKIWMASFKEKQDQHNKLLNSLHAEDGPIRSLQRYINSEKVKAEREAILSHIVEAREKQAVLEKETRQQQEDFFMAKHKEVDLKLQLDAAHDDHAKYGALMMEWKKLEADVEMAKITYRQKLGEEKSTRTTFINEMKRFQDQSDGLEKGRLQVLQQVMTSMIQSSKSAESKRKERLEPLFDEGISHLEKYDIEREIALFNEHNVYRHEFPVEQVHPSEVLAKKEAEENSLINDALTTKADLAVELKNVQVLQAEDQKAVSLRSILKLAVSEEEKQTRHVRFAIPKKSDIIYIPARKRKKKKKCIFKKKGKKRASKIIFPIVPTTAVGITHIPQGQSVKVYAMKDLTAESVNDLTCKEGCKIHMVKPAMNDRAFGYIEKGTFLKKRIYGYFNDQHVSIYKNQNASSTFWFLS